MGNYPSFFCNKGGSNFNVVYAKNRKNGHIFIGKGVNDF